MQSAIKNYCFGLKLRARLFSVYASRNGLDFFCSAGIPPALDASVNLKKPPARCRRYKINISVARQLRGLEFLLRTRERRWEPFLNSRAASEFFRRPRDKNVSVWLHHFPPAPQQFRRDSLLASAQPQRNLHS